jgi:hypothetical protein
VKSNQQTWGVLATFKRPSKAMWKKTNETQLSIWVTTHRKMREQKKQHFPLLTCFCIAMVPHFFPNSLWHTNREATLRLFPSPPLTFFFPIKEKKKQKKKKNAYRILNRKSELERILHIIRMRRNSPNTHYNWIHQTYITSFISVFLCFFFPNTKPKSIIRFTFLAVSSELSTTPTFSAHAFFFDFTTNYSQEKRKNLHKPEKGIERQETSLAFPFSSHRV